MFTVEKAPEKMTFYSEHKYYAVKKKTKKILIRRMKVLPTKLPKLRLKLQ